MRALRVQWVLTWSPVNGGRLHAEYLTLSPPPPRCPRALCPPAPPSVRAC